MTLPILIYREQLFPRRAYRRAFEALLTAEGEKPAMPAAAARRPIMRKASVRFMVFLREHAASG